MRSDSARDRDLVRRLQRDPEAVGELFDRYSISLARHLESYGADPDTAIDAVQETFARLLA